MVAEINSVHSRLSLLASVQPDAIFSRDSSEEISYGEAYRTSEKISAWIQQQPFFEIGQPLFTFCEAKPAYLPLILGVLNSGMVWAGLEPNSPIGHNKNTLSCSAKPILIVPNEYIPEFPNFGVSEPLFIFEGISIGEQFGRSHEVDSESNALIIFTSGSTDKPKGVLRRQSDLFQNANAQSLAYSFGPNDSIAAAYSTNTMGFLRAFLNTVCSGGCYRPVKLSDTGEDGLLRSLADPRVNNLHIVAPVFRKIFKTLGSNKIFNNIERVILGGDAATPDDLALFQTFFSRSCELFSSLGSSEAGTISIWKSGHGYNPEREKLPCGQVLPSVKTLLDVDGKVSTPSENEVGELLVSSPSVAKEYWSNQDLSNKKWVKQGNGEIFYRTGDLVAFDEMGLLHHFGRVDTAAKINGVLVDPAAVEHIIVQYHGVAEVVVLINFQSGNGKPTVEAFLVLTPDFQANEFDGYLDTHLLNAAKPKMFYEMDRTPRTRTGKTVTTSLDYSRPFNLKPKPAKHKSPNLDALRKIWVQILEISEIGDQDDFIALGGDSLDFITLVLKIEEQFGVKFSVDELAGILTLTEMTNAISKKTQRIQISSKPNACEIIKNTVSAWRGTSIGRKELIKTASSSPGVNLFWCLQSDIEFQLLSKQLAPSVKLHALRSLNLLIKRTDSALNEVAELYADEIMSVHKDLGGPLYLGGNCQGSTLMLLVAKILQNKGVTIDHFIMMEKFFDEPINFPVTMLFGDKSERNLYRHGDLSLSYAMSQYKNLRGIYEISGQHGHFFSALNIDSLRSQIMNALTYAEDFIVNIKSQRL